MSFLKLIALLASLLLGSCGCRETFESWHSEGLHHIRRTCAVDEGKTLALESHGQHNP